MKRLTPTVAYGYVTSVEWRRITERLAAYEATVKTSNTECKSPKELFADLAELERYREIGKPEELVRVVRCVGCAYFTLWPGRSDVGDCEKYFKSKYVDGYCDQGINRS